MKNRSASRTGWIELTSSPYTVEIGTGAYPGAAHCKPRELLASEGKLKEFQAAIAESGLTISGVIERDGSVRIAG